MRHVAEAVSASDSKLDLQAITRRRQELEEEQENGNFKELVLQGKSAKRKLPPRDFNLRVRKVKTEPVTQPTVSRPTKKAKRTKTTTTKKTGQAPISPVSSPVVSMSKKQLEELMASVAKQAASNAVAQERARHASRSPSRSTSRSTTDLDHATDLITPIVDDHLPRQNVDHRAYRPDLAVEGTICTDDRMRRRHVHVHLEDTRG